MEKEVTYIEVCVGVGMDQLTPEYIKIPVYPEEKEKRKGKKEIEIETEK
jgi:hypothetical protein